MYYHAGAEEGVPVLLERTDALELLFELCVSCMASAYTYFRASILMDLWSETQTYSKELVYAALVFSSKLTEEAQLFRLSEACFECQNNLPRRYERELFESWHRQGWWEKLRCPLLDIAHRIEENEYSSLAWLCLLRELCRARQAQLPARTILLALKLLRERSKLPTLIAIEFTKWFS